MAGGGGTLLSSLQSILWETHFTDEEVEARGGQVTFPESHTVVELGRGP